MRWQGRRQSQNVEDRRGVPARGVAFGGGLIGLVFVVIYLLMGGNPAALMQQQPPGQGGGAQVQPGENRQKDDPIKEFVSVVLADTEDVWGKLFRDQLRRQYELPTLVIFEHRVDSACGLASAAVGPFYCPMDQKVYLDFSFFEQLRSQLGAPGDFAMAYVIAHEIGHHVQNLLGLSDEVHRRQSQSGQVEANQLSVRLELQADFLAGVWAFHAQKMKQILEPGDVEEALRAATAIGDDRLQRQSRGYVVPDSFTHGTSAQRLNWFRRGFTTGDLSLMSELFERPYDSL
jgi:predicted metalloprotease